MVILLEGAVGAAGSPAAAQVSAPPPFDLGYGPSTLFPASQGTPVFSAGDQLWVRSHENTNLVIRASYLRSNSTYFVGTVEPEIPTRLLFINATDPQGIWSLRAINSSLAPILFMVSDVASVPENLTLAGAHLSSGVLDMNFTTSPDVQLQDAQACTLGSQNSSRALVPVPASGGGGTIALVLNGNAIDATTSGPGTGNFTLQVDLYYSYAFLAPDSTSILLFRSERAATTSAVLITKSNPSGSLLLQADGKLKTGRYELYLYFQGPQGIVFATTDVLITGGDSWVWLGACTNTPVYSNDFSIASSLGADPSSWPRTLWLTYTAFGEQGFANLSLGVDPATLTFMGNPWGVPLSSYDIRAATSTGIQEAGVQNGTMFMILSSHQASVNYTIGLGGETLFRGETGPIEPFTSTIIPFNVSELVVTYFVGGALYGGGTVSVSNTTGVFISAVTNKNGQAIFYLPAGGYNITAAGGNSTTSRTVTLPFGQRFALDLGLQPSAGTGGNASVWALGVVAAAGVAINAIVFLRGRRKG